MAEKRETTFGNSFKEKVILKRDLKSIFYRNYAAKFLDETFGEMLDDDKFLRWLAKSLDYKTFRLKKF